MTTYHLTGYPVVTDLYTIDGKIDPKEYENYKVAQGDADKERGKTFPAIGDVYDENGDPRFAIFAEPAGMTDLTRMADHIQEYLCRVGGGFAKYRPVDFATRFSFYPSIGRKKEKPMKCVSLHKGGHPAAMQAMIERKKKKKKN